MVSLALIPSLSWPVFRVINFQKRPSCSSAPGLLLADEAPTWYRNSKQNTKYVVQYHSGLWVQQMVSSGWWRKRVVKHQCLWDSISQQEQLTRLTPIFARLLSPLCGFWGFQHGRSFPRKKSGQDNSQGQASEYFECTRKHYEHRYNITMMCWKYFMLMTSVTKDKWNSDACKQVIHKNAITW